YTSGSRVTSSETYERYMEINYARDIQDILTYNYSKYTFENDIPGPPLEEDTIEFRLDGTVTWTDTITAEEIAEQNASYLNRNFAMPGDIDHHTTTPIWAEASYDTLHDTGHMSTDDLVGRMMISSNHGLTVDELDRIHETASNQNVVAPDSSDMYYAREELTFEDQLEVMGGPNPSGVPNLIMFEIPDIRSSIESISDFSGEVTDKSLELAIETTDTIFNLDGERQELIEYEAKGGQGIGGRVNLLGVEGNLRLSDSKYFSGTLFNYDSEFGHALEFNSKLNLFNQLDVGANTGLKKSNDDIRGEYSIGIEARGDTSLTRGNTAYTSKDIKTGLGIGTWFIIVGGEAEIKLNLSEAYRRLRK
ncbi:hypothetical protein, partial [Alkalibacillus haloalkaliphilus]|uniref:hypothetical protein n=1 Tax=Alkalibacillus haloalkaliphilus TaxID=94136 RepID=UPI001C3F669C